MVIIHVLKHLIVLGLNPLQTVSNLQVAHTTGQANSGISVRRGCIADMAEERVLQPLLVTVSALTLATETVRSILKIDDIVSFLIVILIQHYNVFTN